MNIPVLPEGFIHLPRWVFPQSPNLVFDTVVSFQAECFVNPDKTANDFMEQHDYALLHIEANKQTRYFMCHKDEHNSYRR